MREWTGLMRKSLMKNRSSVALTALILCCLTATIARADDLLGLYLGASFGQAHIRAQQNEIVPQVGGSLDMTHSAFKGMLGVRVLSFLGAEVAYMDLGTISGMGGQQVPAMAGSITAEQVSQKGEAAFALLYLPVPVIDVYLKAGLSRITTDSSATITPQPGIGTCPIDRPACGAMSHVSHDFTDTSFAYGAGLQWKLGDWAVRGEYERFDAAGANPSLLSIGMTYWIE
jgi:opacity protein-like surface antigen